MSRHRPTPFSPNFIAVAFILTPIGCLTAAAATGHEPAGATGGSTQPAVPISGPTVHKFIAPAGALYDLQPGVERWHDYGTFALYKLSDEAQRAAAAATSGQVGLVPVVDRLEFDRHPVDTRMAADSVPQRLSAPAATGPALHLIQFVGPIKDAWLKGVATAGGTPVQYIASNGYLVWTVDTAARERLRALADAGDFVQYSGPYHPAFKLGSTVENRILSGADPAEIVPIVIQIYNHPGKHTSQDRIADLTVEHLSDWSPILAFENIIVTVRAADLLTIAQLPDVVWVGERLPRELTDEVQGQILAGNLDGTRAGPSGPGYKTWLDSFAFSQNPGDYPIVSVTDDGVGNGTTANGAGDDTLTHLRDGTTSRVAFAHNCTTDGSADGRGGHGHINTSIISGYDTRAGSPYQFPSSYQRGQGVNPYGRTGNTKIFSNSGYWDISACGGTDSGVIKREQDNGAAISSNSWGCGGCASTYDESSQAYDAGVRDADPTEPGNQPIVYVFAAGNEGSGAGTIGSPGNGKNMITVGASENQRQTDENGAWTDGCRIGPTGADNAMDVIAFSSRGPAPGSRVKPEVIAPGTHIQGTASTAAGYDGSGVCDQYRPTGQTIFAASSGTSHSTPAVAGVASLYYRWLQTRHGLTTPSPAMIKAYLLGHPTYLTGVAANDTLPSNSQGYGMPDMKAAFDDTPRTLLDQTQIFGSTGQTWTWTGSVANATKPVRIALAYTDAPGAIGTSPQVNDLNLIVVVNGVTYLGNRFTGQWSTTGGTADSANNYEAIYLPVGTSGPVTITVTAANIAGDGVPNNADTTDQDFALVCYNCLQEADFTLTGTPTSRTVCAPATADYTINVGSILGFANAVTLNATGQPTGATALFNPNPVTPAGTSAFTIGNTAAATPGAYTLTVGGAASGGTSKSIDLGLDLYNTVPGQSALTAPANGATNVGVTPTFTWNAPAQAGDYTIEVATDSGFTQVVASETGLTSPTWVAPTALNTSTRYYWRVKAGNACGTGSSSSVFHFSTLAAPGDCDLGTTPNIIYQSGFESGAGGWTSNGTGNTWAIATTNPRGGTKHFHADDLSSISDQRLISPAVTVPAGQLPVSLNFWHAPYLEAASSGCWDAGILEVTNDSGTTWVQVPDANLLVGAYTGPISTAFGNPLGGRQGWCGDGAAYRNTIADLSAYAGQTVQFRLRLGTDNSVGKPGWDFDDVVVQSCAGSQNICQAAALTIGPEVFGPGTQSRASEQSLSTQGAVELQTGADVTFRAPYLRFGAGFRVANGAVLKARAEAVNCSAATRAIPKTAKTSTAATQSAERPLEGPIPIGRLDRLPTWIQAMLVGKGVDLAAASHALLDPRGLWLLFTTPQALQASDRNGADDLYRLDLFADRLDLVSRAPNGAAGNGASGYPAADASGDWVVFQSDATDLVKDDNNDVTDIFLHDVPLGETTRLTAGDAGASAHPALDAAGVDLLYDQRGEDGQRQVMIEDLWADHEPEPISLERGSVGQLFDNHHPAISTDGRFVAYLEALAGAAQPLCSLHFYDRETARYQRLSCPDALTNDPESARPYFSTDGAQVNWLLFGVEEPVVVPNPLQTLPTGTAR